MSRFPPFDPTLWEDVEEAQEILKWENDKTIPWDEAKKELFLEKE
jgi:hypothetical protein